MGARTVVVGRGRVDAVELSNQPGFVIAKGKVIGETGRPPEPAIPFEIRLPSAHIPAIGAIIDLSIPDPLEPE